MSWRTDEQPFARAALRLGTAPPTPAHQIKKLESERDAFVTADTQRWVKALPQRFQALTPLKRAARKRKRIARTLRAQIR